MKRDVILGTIIGDVVGSRFEINNNKYGKNFEMFNKNCRFTDDSIMTLAIAKALCESNENLTDIESKSLNCMIELGKLYPKCGYGPSFYKWLMSDDHLPYSSFGNGAAMRISAVAVALKDVDEIVNVVDIITNLSHNHTESLAGAEAICVAIRLALNGSSKSEIKNYIDTNYFKINELRNKEMKPSIFHINCIETVKQSISAFMDSNDYEDAIRNAVAIGGDTDTICAITGGLAAAFYGIPENFREKIMEYLDEYLIEIYNRFNNKFLKQ